MPFLSPITDIAFKKIFADKNKKEIVLGFLKAITGQSVSNITYVEGVSQPKLPWIKSSIEPIRCTDAHGITYIIDMQVIDQKEYTERCQYYMSLEITRQWAKADTYKKLSPVCFIGITHFSVFNDEMFLRRHAFVSVQAEIPLQEFYCLELSKFTKKIEQLSGAVDQWLYFLKYGFTHEEVPAQCNKSKDIVAAFEAVRHSTFTKKELEAHSELMEAYKLEADRIQGARLEGEYEAARRIARKLIEKGIDVETISAVTGIAAKECARLAA